MARPWLTGDAFIIACRQTHAAAGQRRQWIEIAFGQPIQTIRVDLPFDRWQVIYRRHVDSDPRKPDFRLELHALAGGIHDG